MRTTVRAVPETAAARRRRVAQHRATTLTTTLVTVALIGAVLGLWLLVTNHPAVGFILLGACTACGFWGIGRLADSAGDDT